MRKACLSLVLASLAIGSIGLAQNAATNPSATNALVIQVDQAKETIAPEIYGHFSEHLGRCIYEGLWVGENSPIPNVRGIRTDVVEALKNMKIPVLRWPGGCFADEYHWRDGIGPRNRRPAMINTHWGGVVENNHFGTHEFLDLCEQLGCKAYISGNVGSGSVQEMMEWVEYMTSDANSPMANLRRQNGRDKPWKVAYLGVGNESWGCGGTMRPEFYADQYRRYNTFVKNYPGSRIYRIACGANSTDYNWTEVLMSNAGDRMNGLSLHYYTIPTGNWGRKGSATEFGEDLYLATLHHALEMETLVARHGKIMDKQDPRRQIGMIVDEWGIWTDVEPGTNPGFLYQQNSLRDALVAGVTLNIFNRHCDRVKMANIAQTINVLQAVILTDGSRILLTPTYHVFEMYKGHQGATWVPTELKCRSCGQGENQVPSLNVSASKDKAGKVLVTICNLDPQKAADLPCQFKGLIPKSVRGRVLTAEAVNRYNTFEKTAVVEPKAFTGFKLQGDRVQITVPSKSVVSLEIE